MATNWAAERFFSGRVILRGRDCLRLQNGSMIRDWNFEIGQGVWTFKKRNYSFTAISIPRHKDIAELTPIRRIDPSLNCEIEKVQEEVKMIYCSVPKLGVAFSEDGNLLCRTAL